ncbi:MAG: Gfo/Idh/MocA family oxidoreductase [Lentisphaeria bacterium]|nr:Gfo/Idh/MocA family oxidoreductase [Lentisphaeria bacterium]
MGQTHTGNLLRSRHATIAAIVDPCPPEERLANVHGNRDTVFITASDIAGIPHFVSLDEALQNVTADAAIVALPTKLHSQAVIKCLNAGLHVFVEKPFAVEADECDAMLNAAAMSGKILAVGYVVRAMGAYAKLRNECISHRLGKLHYMRLTRMTGVPLWGNWSDPEFVRSSGGALFDLTSHDVDFARYCLGDPERITVNNELKKVFNGNMISAVASFKESKVEFSGGFVLPPALPFECGVQAFFENAAVCISANGNCYRETRHDGTFCDTFFSGDDPYAVEIENFLQAIINNSPTALLCTAEDAARTAACCREIMLQIQK